MNPALIDFADPRAPQAPRLRSACGAPRQILAARSHDEVRPVLDAVEAAARAGLWCLGWLAYEAAPAFDAAMRVHAAQGDLAWFAVYDAPAPWPQDGAQEMAAARITWSAGLARSAFGAALEQIHAHIAAGRCYQVNFTAPMFGQLEGDARALFAALRRAQPGGYAAHIDAGDGRQVLSVSPELFFDWRAAPDGSGAILTRPMKGTAARGAGAAEDAARERQLRESPKERAENVMIVDLLRNDLSRIAQPGSVRVPRLLQTQALATVWQMTSDVQADTRAGTRLADVFAALFPCGSVTGAPKIEAMRIIHALEGGPRGVYCGALGLVRPDPQCGAGAVAATFNVPIRTLQLQGRRVRCDVGSGIVWDAQPQAEWREWAAKRAFAERASAPFELLETLALQDGRHRHLPQHLARLQRSAAHFGYPCDAQSLTDCLEGIARAHPTGLWRTRLLLDVQGRARAEAFALAATPVPVLLALAPRPFAFASSEFVRHKTTRREHYAAFAPEPDSGVFDTLLYNDDGEVTETTFGNVAALLDGRWITPPEGCGLLPGVGRAVLLREGRLREGVLRLADVPRVQEWAFVNSLRGWLPARLQR